MALKTEKYRKYYLKCSNTFLAGCINNYLFILFYFIYLFIFAFIDEYPRCIHINLQMFLVESTKMHSNNNNNNDKLYHFRVGRNECALIFKDRNPFFFNIRPCMKKKSKKVNPGKWRLKRHFAYGCCVNIRCIQKNYSPM